MASQPCRSTADLEPLFDSMKRAAAQLENVVAEGQSILKRNNVFMNQVRTHLEQRDYAREQGRHNDKYMASLQYGLAEDIVILRSAGYRLADQDEGLRPSLQHQRNNLDPLEFGACVRPCRSPLSYGAPNEQPTLDGWYDVADGQMVSGQHKNCLDFSALPYSMPEDRVISDNERRGHPHGHRFGDNRHPLISAFKPATLLDTYHDPRDSYFRRGLDRDIGTGHCDIESLEPHPTHGLEARLDSTHDNDLAMPLRPHHRNFERANARAPWHHSTEYPYLDHSEDHRIGKDLCEAQARQTLDPRSTRQLATLNFPGVLRAATAAGIDHWSSQVRIHDECDVKKQRLEQMKAQLREQNAAACGILKRKADHIARTPRPAPNLFNDDLGQLPQHSYDVPFRPHKKGTIHACTARKDDFGDPTLPVHPVQQVDDLNQPRVAVAMSKALSKAATEDTFHGQQHAQGPVVDARRSNAAHNKCSVGAITGLSNNDEDPIIPSHPSSDSSESSENGYDTPDFDESSSAGDEDKNDAEGLGWVGM